MSCGQCGNLLIIYDRGELCPVCRQLSVLDFDMAISVVSRLVALTTRIFNDELRLRRKEEGNTLYPKFSLMTKSIIIDTTNFFIALRVLTAIRKKQNGKCHFCGIDFVSGDIIVSCGHRRSYYHKRCAGRLNII